MLNIFAIALFQIASITSSAPQQTLALQEPAGVSADLGGTGGWGNDINATGGTGGWGNDDTLTGGTGGWGNDDNLTGGTGGWGNDDTLTGGTGGWGNDID